MFSELKRLLKLSKAKIKYRNVYFSTGANIDKNAVFEGQNKIGKNSWFEGHMGYGSYIGDECVLKAKVGRFCSIGHKVTVLTGTHPSKIFVSTSPMFYSIAKQNGATFVNQQKFKEVIYADEDNRYGVIIGNDVWIGYGATIMGGCVIGDGAIIASGALVNNDVEPYTIVAGQPAKEIGKRFNDTQIDFLIKFRWWNKPLEWIEDNINIFENIEQLMMRNNN